MGSKIRRIKINGTPNRMGLIFLVLKSIADYGINIVTMESDPYICCKIEWDDSLSEQKFIEFMQQRVPEIESISYIDLMEYERIEVELSTLLNNIDDAIIQTDARGNIVSYNNKGKSLLERKHGRISNLKSLLKDSCPNFENCVNESNIEFVDDRDYKPKRLFAHLNPIKNEQNIVTSYLIIVKKLENIRNLINTVMRPSMVTFESIQGESYAIKQTIALAKSVSKSEASVMIRGESGTGKELFARAIHMESLRNGGPFVAVNCASIPETLIESEFFGYEKGSFTGANSSGKQGYFEQATGGTLFLDEIGELAPHLQAKLLRALQEKKIRRIGGKQEIDIDVRVLSATNRDLEEMIRDKSFREDLYYRLNIIPIFIPPLRDREGDIERMAYYLVSDICRNSNRPELPIAQEAMDKLVAFKWPGNVRELNNVLERAVFVAEEIIEEKDIILDYHQLMYPRTNEKNSSNERNQFPFDLPNMLKELEYGYIEKAVEKFGSYRKAAANLNISHTSLISKVNQHKK